MVRLHFGVLGDDEEFNQFLDEFQAESDRAAAVLGAAYLDDLLKQLLLDSWVDEGDRVKSIVAPNQPIGSFGPRLLVAYATGLISAAERHDLDLVRKIRNRFAHRLTGWSFDQDEIANRCGAFLLVEERMAAEPDIEAAYRDGGARKVFDLEVTLLAYYLTRRVRNAQRAHPPEPPLWPQYDIGGERR